jgi:hypothetical protein
MGWAPARIGGRREGLELPALLRAMIGRTEIAAVADGFRTRRKTDDDPRGIDLNAPHPMIIFADLVSREENATGTGTFQPGIYPPHAGQIGGFEFARVRRIRTLPEATTNRSCGHS